MIRIARRAGQCGIPLLAALSVVGCSHAVVEGSCIAPSISASANPATAGKVVTVRGRAFLSVCGDDGQHRVAETSVPIVLKVSGQQPVTLATAHPSANGDFSTVVTIPADVAGSVVLQADLAVVTVQIAG